jgi:hypothetical protein
MQKYLRAVVLGSLIAATAAFAGASPQVRAQRRFDQGRTLMSKGKVAEACLAFQDSLSLDPALGTMLNVADCMDRLGEAAEAYRAFERAAAWAKRTHEPKREEAALARLATLRPKVGIVHIVGVHDGQPTWNGTPVLLTDGVFVVVASPGSHRLALGAPGKKTWQVALEVQPGSEQAIEPPPLEADVPPPPIVVIEPAPAPAPAPALVPPPPPAPPPAAVAVRPAPAPAGSPVGLTLVAVGAVLAAAGVAGVSYSFWVKDAVGKQQPGGPNEANPTVTQGQYESLRIIYPVAIAGAAAGVLTAAVGTVVIITHRGSTEVQVAPAPGGIVVGGRF